MSNVRPGCVDYSKFDAMDFSDDSDDERERQEREERYRVQEEQEARRRREETGGEEDDDEDDEDFVAEDGDSYEEEDDESYYSEDDEEGSYDDEESDESEEDSVCALCRILLTEPSIIHQRRQNRGGNNGLSIAYGDCGHAYHLDCVQQWLISGPNSSSGCCALCSQSWNFASIERISDDDLAQWRQTGQRQYGQNRDSWVDEQLRKPRPRHVVPEATLSQLKQAWFPGTTVDDKGNVRQNEGEGGDDENGEDEDSGYQKPSAEDANKIERFCANCHQASPPYRCSR